MTPYCAPNPRCGYFCVQPKSYCRKFPVDRRRFSFKMELWLRNEPMMSNYVKEDHCSFIRNFCSCEKKAWKEKKFRLVRDSNPWPLWYQCSAVQLSWQANWEQVIELVCYKPMKGWWWNYEYMKIIYVNCGVKNYLSYLCNLCSCEKKVLKKKCLRDV